MTDMKNHRRLGLFDARGGASDIGPREKRALCLRRQGALIQKGGVPDLIGRKRDHGGAILRCIDLVEEGVRVTRQPLKKILGHRFNV